LARCSPLAPMAYVVTWGATDFRELQRMEGVKAAATDATADTLFCEETGVPLNQQAQELVQRAKAGNATVTGAKIAAADALSAVPSVIIAEGKW
jgi:hypothetical protein